MATHAVSPVSPGGGSTPGAVLGVVAGAACVAVAARVSVAVPGFPVPQSLQTLAVVVAGGILGARRGAGALLLYLAAGAAGAPVFADGARGAAHLAGPTAGYLAGFVLAAALVGAWADRGWTRRPAAATAGTSLGHVVILVAGWARLAVSLGGGDAWRLGVAPFVMGGAVKALVGALLLVAWHRWAGRTAGAVPAA